MGEPRYPEYEPEAQFRCSQGCGTFRRDQCHSFRGSLCCPRCRWRWTLSYVRSEPTTPDEAYRPRENAEASTEGHRHDRETRLPDLADASTERRTAVTTRLHCNHCPARFNTEWERIEHERKAHPIAEAPSHDVAKLVEELRQGTERFDFGRLPRKIIPPTKREIKIAELLESLSRDLAEARERIGGYAITEEYDFPGDVPEFCGFWCNECKEHVEADGSGHRSDCICHGITPNTPRAKKDRARSVLPQKEAACDE